jgi:hypothetical protein
MPDEPNKQSAPYLPFKTFLGALEALNHGVPPIIDRSIWRTQPGGVQGQIMGALRFFNLIDEANKPTENLRRLVEKREHRQKAIRALLEWSYANLIAGDLTKMTAKMLEDGIEQYGVSGETRKKAVTFFLQAARYGDLALSPYLQSQIRATPGTRRRRRKDGEESNPGSIAINAPAVASAGPSRTIELKSGGTVTVTVSINPFNLAKADRDFVFELIDKVTEYEQRILTAEKIAKAVKAS